MHVDSMVTLHLADCRDVLAGMADNSVDSIVTDPPYELGFMGKSWDGSGIAYDVAMWSECLRVLKPGGHLLSFGATRTYHRLAVAVEDAGFQIRDSLMWIYGSGFPKSLDVSKAIDKAAGATRVVVGVNPRPGGLQRGQINDDAWTGGGQHLTAPATPDAVAWAGWGTALKPAFEPIVVARKPLVGTVAGNVLAFGCGAINVGGCRVGTAVRPVMVRTSTDVSASSMSGASTGATGNGEVTTLGRWPANVLLDPAAGAVLDEQSGMSVSTNAPRTSAPRKTVTTALSLTAGPMTLHADSGGASRFFPSIPADDADPLENVVPFRYMAKAPKRERPVVDGVAHPTVKPVALMEWLVRLVTPAGGTVFEPFAGSGTTVEACIREGMRVVACELTPEYVPLILHRVARGHAYAADQAATAAVVEPDLFTMDRAA